MEWILRVVKGVTPPSIPTDVLYLTTPTSQELNPSSLVRQHSPSIFPHQSNTHLTSPHHVMLYWPTTYLTIGTWRPYEYRDYYNQLLRLETLVNRFQHRFSGVKREILGLNSTDKGFSHYNRPFPLQGIYTGSICETCFAL